MNIAIISASLSGNTTAVATDMQLNLTKLSHKVTLYDAMETRADELKQYDLVFIGSSTYGDGDLNPISEMFFSKADSNKHNCSQTKFAIFSLGDSSYPQFAASSKIMKDNLTKMGATIILPILTLDGPADEVMFLLARKWSEEMIVKV